MGDPFMTHSRLRWRRNVHPALGFIIFTPYPVARIRHVTGENANWILVGLRSGSEKLKEFVITIYDELEVTGRRRFTFDYDRVSADLWISYCMNPNAMKPKFFCRDIRHVTQKI